MKAIRVWLAAVQAVYREMEEKERLADYMSVEYAALVPRTTLVMLTAPVPPLARYLQRKLM